MPALAKVTKRINGPLETIPQKRKEGYYLYISQLHVDYFIKKRT